MVDLCLSPQQRSGPRICERYQKSIPTQRRLGLTSSCAHVSNLVCPRAFGFIFFPPPRLRPSGEPKLGSPQAPPRCPTEPYHPRLSRCPGERMKNTLGSRLRCTSPRPSPPTLSLCPTYINFAPVAPSKYAQISSQHLHSSLFTRTWRSPLLSPPHHLVAAACSWARSASSLSPFPPHPSFSRLPRNSSKSPRPRQPESRSRETPSLPRLH